jgi:hypothetical protein
MHDRCKNPKYALFYRYGGRGIEVCSEWSSFEKFYSDMGDPFDGASLDRIDNDKGYFRENCRWATAQQNNSNRCCSRKITWQGKTQPVSIWSKEVGIPYSTLNPLRRLVCQRSLMMLHPHS